MHVYLIGMPGAGKTTLGRQIAVLLNRTFVDLDQAIVSKANQSIPEIFAENDEAYFRKLEAETLKTVSFSDEKLIIATGGGTPCFQNNLELMHSRGIIIYLKTTPEILLQRLQSSPLKDRPLLKERSGPQLFRYLEQTLASRKPFYEQAGIIFDSNQDPGKAVLLAELIRKTEQPV